MAYSFESRVRFSEIDKNENMTLHSMVNYFQDCATFHSEEVGFGFHRNQAAGQAWVIAGMQILVKRWPQFNEQIRISTWATRFRGMIGLRSNSIETTGGELLVAANAQWVYMDMNRQVPMRVPAEQTAAYGTEPDKAFSEEEVGSRKIQIPDEGGTAHEPFAILEQHLDINGHVNNGQFVLMSMKYFPELPDARRLRLEFSRQAFPGDMICPYVYTLQDGMIVTLCGEDGKPFFIAEAR